MNAPIAISTTIGRRMAISVSHMALFALYRRREPLYLRCHDVAVVEVRRRARSHQPSLVQTAQNLDHGRIGEAQTNRDFLDTVAFPYGQYRALRAHAVHRVEWQQERVAMYGGRDAQPREHAGSESTFLVPRVDSYASGAVLGI